MNRLDRLKGVLWLESLAAKATEESAKLRAELGEEAVEEFKRDGSAPTWRFPDLATVTLSISKDSFYVSDPEVFRNWVAARHPDGVEPRVREVWQRLFLEGLEVEGDRVFQYDGEVVPGVAVRRGGQPRNLTVKASPQAKEVYGIVAAEGLKVAAINAGPAVPVVLAEIGQADG